MNQETTLGLAGGLLLASLAALWPVLTLGNSIRERMESRVAAARITLGRTAKDTLRDIRVLLDEIFAAADGGDDPWLTKVDPDAVLDPAREYTKYVTTASGLMSNLTVLQKRSRAAFVVLVIFVVCAALTVFAGAVGYFIGLAWAYWGLCACGALFVVGSVCFLRIVAPYRKIDAGVGLATQIRLERGEDDANTGSD